MRTHTVDTVDTFDAVVVGGSFAGLAAALQLARARRRVLVVDAGRPRNRFARASHGFLGQDGRAPAAIVAAGRAEVLAYPAAELRDDEITHAHERAGAFRLTLAAGATVGAHRLVLATGVVDELPDLPGLRERWGRTVLHCPYCHGYEVADGRLGVLATGAASVHQALLLPDWSAEVTLFTNGALALDAAQREALAARGVRVDERPVAALVGDAPTLAGVRLAGGETVPIDALFTGARTRMASPLAEQLGCAFDEGPAGPVEQAHQGAGDVGAGQGDVVELALAQTADDLGVGLQRVHLGVDGHLIDLGHGPQLLAQHVPAPVGPGQQDALPAGPLLQRRRQPLRAKRLRHQVRLQVIAPQRLRGGRPDDGQAHRAQGPQVPPRLPQPAHEGVDAVGAGEDQPLVARQLRQGPVNRPPVRRLPDLDRRQH
jgi:thioredoxin reductase